MFHVKVIFENPTFNFCTTISEMTKEEIIEDIIGDTFNFEFKGGGLETCINVEIT